MLTRSYGTEPSRRVRPRRQSSLTFALLVVALVALRVAVVVVELEQDATRGRHTVLPGDVRRYYRIGTTPGVPYRDFPVEYPPVTLGAIELLTGPNLRSTTVAVMWSQLVVDLAIAAIVAWGWGRRASLAYLVLGTAFLFYPFLYLRLDLLSVALAVAALALLRRRHPTASGVTLAVACFAKVWPVVLIPRLLLARSARALVAFAAVAAGGLVAWIAYGGTDGPVQVLTFRGATGWQIESTVGAVVHVFSTEPARIVEGAFRIGAVPGWATVVLFALAGALVVFTWACARRAGDLGGALLDGVAPLATISALLLTATIISPQYLAWLLPFAAIAVAQHERRVAFLTYLACFLSVVDLNLVTDLRDGSPLAMIVVLARNVVLAVLLVVTLGRLASAARRRGALAALPEAQQRVA